MNTEHSPVVANDQPLDTIPWSYPLPPHRFSVCPSTVIIGMAHQNLLTFIHSVLTGETVVLNSNWFTNHVNEAILRGLLFRHFEMKSQYSHSYPTDLQGFMNVFRIRDGWNWVQEQRPVKQKQS